MLKVTWKWTNPGTIQYLAFFAISWGRYADGRWLNLYILNVELGLEF